VTKQNFSLLSPTHGGCISKKAKYKFNYVAILSGLTRKITMATDISHVIQLAVAPVFLLAGIGAFVNAFAVRLGRIFDRSRKLEERFPTSNPTQREKIRDELDMLARRSRTAYIGIALDVFAALLVCVLIASAFAGYFFGFEVRGIVAGLFIAAMLSLIGGLVAFLREIFIAVRSLSTLSPHLMIRNISASANDENQ